MPRMAAKGPIHIDVMAIGNGPELCRVRLELCQMRLCTTAVGADVGGVGDVGDD